MAKIRKNDILFGLSGSLGNVVFSQMPDGSTRVSMKPSYRRRKATQGQKENRKRFQQAAYYAREAAKTYPIYAELAKGTMKTAYNIALSDWFHPPVIHCIAREDGRIRVQVRDNVMVTKVQVRVVNPEGEVLEAGEARQVDSTWWEFATQTQGTVEVVAWDLAENKAKAVL
ncbi:MAG: hypothetical protein JW963_22060 [Anaerolineales bacterium]|nr:hypothetical protein [Anaerolineales bacterium]